MGFITGVGGHKPLSQRFSYDGPRTNGKIEPSSPLIKGRFLSVYNFPIVLEILLECWWVLNQTALHMYLLLTLSL